MDNKPRSVIYMLISSLSFAMMGAMVKFSGDIPVFEKVFVRNLISLFIAFIVIKKKGTSIFGKIKGLNQMIIICIKRSDFP